MRAHLTLAVWLWCCTVVAQTDQFYTVDDPEQYATPYDAITRILSHINPSKGQTILDVGSGDGRFVLAAALWRGCYVYGIEWDVYRVAAARASAAKLGVSTATFLHADFDKIQWPQADIVFVYQFEEDLAAMRARLMQYPLVVSYAHCIPGLNMVSHNGGEFYTWRKQPLQQGVNYLDIPSHIGGVDARGPFVWYHGRKYRSIGNHNCGMCNYIRHWLGVIGTAWRSAQGAY